MEGRLGSYNWVAVQFGCCSYPPPISPTTCLSFLVQQYFAADCSCYMYCRVLNTQYFTSVARKVIKKATSNHPGFILVYSVSKLISGCGHEKWVWAMHAVFSTIFPPFSSRDPCYC